MSVLNAIGLWFTAQLRPETRPTLLDDTNKGRSARRSWRAHFLQATELFCFVTVREIEVVAWWREERTGIQKFIERIIE